MKSWLLQQRQLRTKVKDSNFLIQFFLVSSRKGTGTSMEYLTVHSTQGISFTHEFQLMSPEQPCEVGRLSNLLRSNKPVREGLGSELCLSYLEQTSCSWPHTVSIKKIVWLTIYEKQLKRDYWDVSEKFLYLPKTQITRLFFHVLLFMK